MEPNIIDYVPIDFKSGFQNIRVLSRKTASFSESAPDLTFETVHPADTSRNFIIAFLNTDNYFSTTFAFDDERHPRNARQLHYHDYFELVYVITGEMYQQIESERHLYPAGSLCLLNCFVRHQEEYSTDHRAVYLRLPKQLIAEFLVDMHSYFFRIEQRFKGQLLEHFFTVNLDSGSNSYLMHKEYIDFIPNEDRPDVKKRMYQLFDQLTQQFLNPQVGSTYIMKCTILQILEELSNAAHYRSVPLNVGTDQEAQLFGSIRNQIQLSNGHISRKELEKKLSYHGTYLNRITKKYSGMSLKQYALTVSMQKAAELLRNTDLRITDICMELRFSNQTYFYKSFEKIYGTTPKKYREERQVSNQS